MKNIKTTTYPELKQGQHFYFTDQADQDSTPRKRVYIVDTDRGGHPGYVDSHGLVFSHINENAKVIVADPGQTFEEALEAAKMPPPAPKYGVRFRYYDEIYTVTELDVNVSSVQDRVAHVYAISDDEPNRVTRFCSVKDWDTLIEGGRLVVL